MSRIVFSAIVAVGLLLMPLPVLALDHDNLDPNRPIGMEDAYAIPKGEIGMEGGVRFNDRREGRTRVTFQPQIIYGAFENTQIEIQGDLMSDPHTLVGAAKSGDLHLGVLYNFNTETISLPAFAARVEVDLPTGVNSKGVDTQMTGILTRSFGRLRVHLNAGYTVLGSPQGAGAVRCLSRRRRGELSPGLSDELPRHVDRQSVYAGIGSPRPTQPFRR